MCSEINRHKNGTEWRNFYGRFKGKSLSPTQSEALLTQYKKYSLENISWDENPQRKKNKALNKLEEIIANGGWAR